MMRDSGHGKEMTHKNDIEIFLFPEESPEDFLIGLIEQYGSLELGIGVSSLGSSRKMAEALQSVTNGFLVLNAVYLDNRIIRVPDSSERETLEKNWKMPFRWLSPGPVPGNSPKEKKSDLTASIGDLDALLRSHGIRAFLMSDGHALLIERSRASSKVLANGLHEEPVPPAYAAL